LKEAFIERGARTKDEKKEKKKRKKKPLSGLILVHCGFIRPRSGPREGGERLKRNLMREGPAGGFFYLNIFHFFFFFFSFPFFFFKKYFFSLPLAGQYHPPLTGCLLPNRTVLAGRASWLFPLFCQFFLFFLPFFLFFIFFFSSLQSS
jgi:hypothetical protein